jgi:hypothetical protein
MEDFKMPQSIDTIKNIVDKWLHSGRVPKHLAPPDGRFPMYGQYFERVWNYVKDHYQAKYNFENLDRAVITLIKLGQLPDYPKQGLSAEEKEQRKQEQRAALEVGVLPSRLPSHADPSQPNTIGSEMRKTAQQMLQDVANGQTYKPKEPEKLRKIPLNTPVEELRKYTAAEIKSYMRRKKESEQEHF